MGIGNGRITVMVINQMKLRLPDSRSTPDTFSTQATVIGPTLLWKSTVWDDFHNTLGSIIGY